MAHPSRSTPDSRRHNQQITGQSFVEPGVSHTSGHSRPTVSNVRSDGQPLCLLETDSRDAS